MLNSLARELPVQAKKMRPQQKQKWSTGGKKEDFALRRVPTFIAHPSNMSQVYFLIYDLESEDHLNLMCDKHRDRGVSN